MKQSFVKTFFETLNPDRYYSLSARSSQNAFLYFLSVLFLSFCLMVVFSIPAFVTVPEQVTGFIDQFEELQFTPDLTSSKPLVFNLFNTDLLFVDTTGETTTISREKILITDDMIHVKRGWCVYFEPACLLYAKENRVSEKPLAEYSDLKQHKDQLASFLTLLLLLVLPALLIFLYLLFFVKYTVTIFLVSSLAFLLAVVLNRDIRYNRIVKISLYASTIMIVPDLLLLPFGVHLYYLPFILYVVLILLGVYFLYEPWVQETETNIIKAQLKKMGVKKEEPREEYMELGEHAKSKK